MTEVMNVQDMLGKATQASRLLKLIGNPHRLAALCALTEKQYNVSELIEIVGISQTSMSNHLGLLREAGLVSFEREHRELNYFISDERVKLVLEVLHQMYCGAEEA